MMMEMFIMVATATCNWYDQLNECLILIDVNSDSHMWLVAIMLDSTGLDFSNLKAKSSCLCSLCCIGQSIPKAKVVLGYKKVYRYWWGRCGTYQLSFKNTIPP